MKMRCLIILLIFLLGDCQVYAQETPQDTIPDNYLLFTLHIINNKLEGESEYLEGFKATMDLPGQSLDNELDINFIMSLIRNQEITGILTYPNGKTTQINYEIVQHRKSEEIYMKTTLGYFLWESLTVRDNKLIFAINWWYCPPARSVDFETLEMAEQLLSDSTNWHKNDDRKCENDIESNRWSLFCALKYSSLEMMGEYNHHNTALQTVRFIIVDLIPEHEFEHTLMDFNNSPSTKHKDILYVLEIAKERVTKELEDIKKE